MVPTESDWADLELVERRTKVGRYRELIEAGRADYWRVVRARAARIRAGKDAPERPLPPLGERVANFAGAVAVHVASGLRHADEATVAARLAVCHGCDQWRRSDGRCAMCGCGVRGKARWRAATCPLGKW